MSDPWYWPIFIRFEAFVCIWESLWRMIFGTHFYPTLSWKLMMWQLHHEGRKRGKAKGSN